MELQKYTDKFWQWITPLFEEKPAELVTDRCCVNVTPTEITLLHVNRLENKVEIPFFITVNYTSLENVPALLAPIVKNNKLDTMPAYWILPPADYQLFLIESMPVTSEELRDALNWRVRSLITYPIEEAVLDYFMIPAKKATPDNPMIAAVVAQMVSLKKIIDVFKKSRLDLAIIDIPELVIKNLTAAQETDERSTAFIYFYDNVAILNISREKKIYFTRHITWAATGVISAKEFEQISLEVMRYFDYFQTQWRHPAPSRVYIGSIHDNAEEIKSKLSEFLTSKIEAYPLANVIGEKQAATFESKYLLNLGSALREKAKNVTTRN